MLDGEGPALLPGTDRRPLTAGDLAAVKFVATILIPQAVHDGVLSAHDGRSLTQLSYDLLREETGAPPATPDRTAPARQPSLTAAAASTADAPPLIVQPAPAARLAPAPSPAPALRRAEEPTHPIRDERPPNRMSTLVGAIGSDLALHGLSYLGVLLLFVGCFGLVAFAFGDVAEGARPVAEVAIAMSPFVAAAVLLRRGARVAGRSLELVGGLLLPVMMMTSLLDGVPFPPDLVGVPLVVALTVIPAACAGGYWLWMRRHPSSALRFLVAPMLWLAAGMVAMGVGREIPSGSGVTAVTAAQVAVISSALAGSLGVARLRPQSPLARPTMTSALVGSVVAASLALLTWYSEDWPSAAIVVTAVAGVIALDLLDGRLPPRPVGMLQAAWWAVTMLALSAGWGDAPTFAVAAAGFAALIERVMRARPSRTAVAIACLGLTGALLAMFIDPWWALAAWSVATVWAHVRRVRPYPVGPTWLQLIDIAAGVLPVGALVALGLATDTWGLPLLAAALVVLLAIVPARRPILRRDADDTFWTTWWQAAAATAVVASVLVTSVSTGQSDDLRWVAAANACLAVAFAVGPVALPLRPWLVLGMASWAWFALAGSLGISVLATTTPPAVVALLCVVAAQVLAARREDRLAMNVGWSGHALAMAVLLPAGLTWAGVVAASLATLGWLVTTAFDSRDRSPVTAPLPEGGRFVPALMAGVGLPATAALAAYVSGVSDPSAPAWSLTAVVTAIAYAIATRLPIGARAAMVALVGACVAGVAGVLLARDSSTAMIALLALILMTLLLPADRRPMAMAWIAWAAIAPLVGLAAERWIPAVDAWPTAQSLSVVLLVAGTVLGVGAAIADLRGRGWVPALLPSRAPHWPPWVLGELEWFAGMVFAWSLVGDPLGVQLTLAAGGVALVFAVVTRVGVLTVVAGSVAVMALLRLLEDSLLERPWTLAVACAVLVVASVVLNAATSERRWWARWDFPVAGVAHLTAIVAALVAVDTGTVDTNFAALGAIALAGVVWLRRQVPLAITYACIATALFLIAAAVAGPGWLSLVLAALSVAFSAVAARLQGVGRWMLQWSGALAGLAAWLAFATYLDLDPQSFVDATCMGSGALVLALAVLLRVRAVDRTWAITWGGMAAGVAVVATMAPTAVSLGGEPSLMGDDVAAQLSVSAATVATALVLAVACAIAAKPLVAGGLRYMAAVFALLAEGELLSLTTAGSTEAVIWLCVTSVVAAIAALLLQRVPDWQVWSGPATLLGALAATCAGVVATTTLPDTALLVPTFVSAAVVAATLGVVSRQVFFTALAPFLVFAAWVSFARAALDANPQWYTVPFGICLITVAQLLRADARRRGADPASALTVTLELGGIGFLVGAGFIQSITDGLAYAVIPIVLGSAVAVWGALTKVRRRLLAGVVVVLVAAAELVIVPLARVLPPLGSVGVWIGIAVVGLVAIGAATVLEASRVVARRAVQGWADLTRDWE